ncbi:nuclear transport factor 2 family protein [Nocardia sp. NPDC057030]|uniref:nuclear transport factor 2 family protein n=1 Tax=unclassified Nocardia TaxID=2637762 RepID=UPI0036341AE8
MDRQVTEVLRRFGRGAELCDRELLVSTLAADAELDPGRATEAWVAHSPLLIGRETIADIVLGMFAGRVETTHTLVEPQVVIDGGRAHLRALADVRHRLITDRAVGVQLIYRYTTELVSTGSQWLLRRIDLETVRYRGDPAAIYCRTPDRQRSGQSILLREKGIQ